MSYADDYIGPGRDSGSQPPLEQRVADLEAELSNCRSQGLENEKEIVTLKLELQALAKKFDTHRHPTHQGTGETGGPTD